MSEQWKVGDRVQTDKDDVIRVGVVTAIQTEQVERSRYTNYYTRSAPEKYMETVVKTIDVKWDDGEEQKGMDRWSVYPEDSKIERTFRLAVSDAHKRIDEKLAVARAALREAEKISEETGIPFSASISPLSQSYIPQSLEQKFPDLDPEFVSDLTQAWGEYGGWQHSAVC